MSKKKSGETKRSTGGYKPLNEGYQPQIKKRGYKPTGPQETTPPKPPKGGTGESSRRKE